MSTEKRIEQLRGMIEREIRRSLYRKDPKSLYMPIDYLMGLRGKRLRPLLVLLAYSIFKTDVRKAARSAVALEMFHNFTLMHDDIMDQSPLRRGEKTVHTKWDVNTAVLSGDMMLVQVYGLFNQLQPGKARHVVAAFNRCAADVCEGQRLDIDYEREERVSEKDYLVMIRSKTASLLGFSLELGCLLGGGRMSDRKALREFGLAVGTGFQLKDDLLDAYGNPSSFGKQRGRDIIANKKTYLLIKAMEVASEAEREELLCWMRRGSFDEQEKVDAVIRIYDHLGVPAITQKRIDRFFQKGFASLDRIRGNRTALNHLRDYARTLIERQV